MVNEFNRWMRDVEDRIRLGDNYYNNRFAIKAEKESDLFDKIKRKAKMFLIYTLAGFSLSLFSPKELNYNQVISQDTIVNTKRPVKVKIVSDNVEVYEVKKGDNLSTIVKNFYNIKGKTKNKVKEISKYNALHNKDKRVRNSIQADFLGYSDKIEGVIEDGIPGDEIIVGSKILLPYETEKSIDLVVDGKDYAQENIESKIENELKSKGYKNFKIKDYKEFKEDEQNDVIVSAYNNLGIKKAREISKLDSDSLYSRLNYEASKGNIVKYSSKLIENRDDKLDFLRDTTNIYLANTNKRAREIIREKYGIDVGSNASLYRMVDKYAVLNKENKKIRKRELKTL